MKTKGSLIRILLSVMAISCMCILCGCGGTMSAEEFEKRKAHQGISEPVPGQSVSLERFIYEFGSIMALTKHRVDIRLLDNEYWYSTDAETYRKLSDEQREKLFDIIDRYQLYSTKENRTGNTEVDGFDFFIQYELTDGTKETDSGQVVYIPGGYSVMDEFDSLFSMGYHTK